jgi:hypothetical protein
MNKFTFQAYDLITGSMILVKNRNYRAIALTKIQKVSISCLNYTKMGVYVLPQGCICFATCDKMIRPKSVNLCTFC